MEKYTEISFILAMAFVALGKEENLYFKDGNTIRSAKKYTFRISEMKEQQWFMKEVIE